MTPQPRRQRLVVEDVGDIAVVSFVDKRILDEQNIQLIGEDFFSLVDELKRRKIVLSFSDVEFMSSALLGKIIRLHQKLALSAGKLVLCDISKEIIDNFEVTRLDKMLTIVESRIKALNEFQNPDLR